MKRKICLLGVLALVLALCGCGNGQVKEAVTSDMEVFTGGSMDQINDMLFGAPEGEAVMELYPAEPEGEGFLAELFAMGDVKVKSVKEDVVVLEITAPDMSDFFTANMDALTAMTSTDEMTALVLAHAAQSEPVTTQVSLGYTLEEERLRIDYTDPAFVDAMTGGLASAYGALYAGMLEALGG